MPNKYNKWSSKKQLDFQHDLEWFNNCELSGKYDLHPSQICRIRHKLDIPMNEATIVRLRDQRATRIQETIRKCSEKDPDFIRKRSANAGAKHIAIRQKEKRRLIMGLEQQTNLKIVFNPKAQHQKYVVKSYLKKVFGYHVEYGTFVLYYDDNTRRDLKREQHYGRKYKFRFQPVTEMQDSDRHGVSAKHDYYVVGEVGSNY